MFRGKRMQIASLPTPFAMNRFVGSVSSLVQIESPSLMTGPSTALPFEKFSTDLVLWPRYSGYRIPGNRMKRTSRLFSTESAAGGRRGGNGGGVFRSGSDAGPSICCKTSSNRCRSAFDNSLSEAKRWIIKAAAAGRRFQQLDARLRRSATPAGTSASNDIDMFQAKLGASTARSWASFARCEARRMLYRHADRIILSYSDKWRRS